MRLWFGLFKRDGAEPIWMGNLDDIADYLLEIEKSGSYVVRARTARTPWRSLSVREEGLLFALMEQKEGRGTVFN